MGVSKKITVTCDLRCFSQSDTYPDEQTAGYEGWLKLSYEEASTGVRKERWVCPQCVRTIINQEKLRKRA